MTDRRQVPMQMQGATQPKTPPGERILVALAAVALLSGALIVAGNLLQKPDEVVNLPSGSPQPSEQPSRTPRPTPSPRPTPAPRELVLEPAPVPTVEVTPTLFSGWIRARVELQILEAPEIDSRPIGVLAAGELMHASDQGLAGEEGWLSVNSTQDQGGWVATRSGGADLVERYDDPPYSFSGGIWSLAAGPHGFVGLGSPAGTSAANPLPILIHSADGARWQLASAPPPPALNPVTAAAWGPAGWLLLSSGPDGRPWLSSSADGSEWTTLGMLRASRRSAYPLDLVGSDAGYLFAESPINRDARGRSLWFSVDAVRWDAVHPGLSTDQYQIGGTTGGFYAWAATGYAPEAAYSADGRTWSRVSGGPASLNFPPVVVGDRLVAIEVDSATNAPRAWSGTVRGGRLSWVLMPDTAASFAGVFVTALASTGDEAIAFGSDPATGAALTWTSTGSDWIRSELPVAFGGEPQQAAAGSAGTAAVGYRRSTLGEDPVIWHRSAAGDWQPESDPVIAPVPAPSLADCAPLPRDSLAFVLLDYSTRAFCYGDATISFRAWSSTHCGDCEPDLGGGLQSAWLAAPAANRLFLSPTESGIGQVVAVLPPALATSPPAAWLDTWLEVRGHFDDAAAATCRYTGWPPYYGAAESTVEACRQQFVVSSLKVVSGP